MPELLARRTRHSRTLDHGDGRRTLVAGRHLHYEYAPGDWRAVVRAFNADGAADASDCPLTYAGGALTVTHRRSGRAQTFSLPGAPVVAGNRVQFTAGGAAWDFRNHGAGAVLVGTVPARLGARTLPLPYGRGGVTAWQRNDDGSLQNDTFRLSAPLVRGADGVFYPIAAWSFTAARVTLAYNDTSVPARAFPLVIDPTLGPLDIAASGDDAYTEDANGALAGSTSWIQAYADREATAGGIIRNAFFRWDTSALDDGATLTGARFTFGNEFVTADGRNLGIEWYAGSNWPITAAGDHANTYASDAGAFALSGIPSGAASTTLTFANTDGISRTGYTGIRCHISGTTAAAGGQISFDTFDKAGTIPALEVDYTLAGGQPAMRRWGGSIEPTGARRIGRGW